MLQYQFCCPTPRIKRQGERSIISSHFLGSKRWRIKELMQEGEGEKKKKKRDKTTRKVKDQESEEKVNLL